MTTTNDKLRSLFLAALMVFSVFAMTVALPGSAAAANYEESGADQRLDSGSTYWEGQEIWFSTGDSEDTTYQVRESEGEDGVGGLETEFTLDEDGNAVIDTADLDGEGDYVIVDSDGNPVEFNSQGESQGNPTTENPASTAEWEVTTQSLDADFDSSNVTNDGTEELDISSNRGTYSVNVSADGLDQEELDEIFGNVSNYDDYGSDEDTIVLRNINDRSIDADFSETNTGQYTFDFEVTDSSASASDTVNVSEAGDEVLGFENNVVTDHVGDVADITVQLDNTDSGAIAIGDIQDQNYQLNATIEDGNDDGEVTVQFNTFTAGSYDDENVSRSDIITVEEGDDSVSIESENGSFDRSEGLLDTTEYDLAVNSQEDFDHADADNAGTLSLRERSTDNMTVHTAPDNSNIGTLEPSAVQAGIGSNITEASDIAAGDVVVHQVEATGLEGVFDQSDNASVIFSEGSPFSLTVEHTNPGANAPSEDLTFDNGELTNDNVEIVSDSDNDTYFIALDYGFGDDEHDNEYESNFTISEDTDLTDDDEEYAAGDFGIVEPETELDTNEDDLVQVEAADNQTITGTTNLAPGSEFSIRVQSDDSTNPFLTRPEITVQPNGTFTATSDFSDLSAGTNLTLTVQGEEFDGQVVEEGTLDQGTETPTENNTTETPDTETPDTETPDTETPDTETPDTDTPTPSDDTGPGFTVVAALGALIAAALLAVRRNN